MALKKNVTLTETSSRKGGLLNEIYPQGIYVSIDLYSWTFFSCCCLLQNKNHLIKKNSSYLSAKISNSI